MHAKSGPGRCRVSQRWGFAHLQQSYILTSRTTSGRLGALSEAIQGAAVAVRVCICNPKRVGFGSGSNTPAILFFAMQKLQAGLRSEALERGPEGFVHTNMGRDHIGLRNSGAPATSCYPIFYTQKTR